MGRRETGNRNGASAPAPDAARGGAPGAVPGTGAGSGSHAGTLPGALPGTLPRAGGADRISRLLRERVRSLRKQKGWTLEALSGACGVSRSMLSQIERGQANPTLAVAYRIAQAFDMPLGELVEVPGATRRLQVIRGDDHTYDFRSESDCRIRTLSPLHLEKDVEFYELWLAPGGALRSSAHFAGTCEYLAVHKGTLRVSAGDEVSELHSGDSAYYPADVAHAIENIGRGEATAYLVDIYQQR